MPGPRLSDRTIWPGCAVTASCQHSFNFDQILKERQTLLSI
jgi:hypothetical protein